MPIKGFDSNFQFIWIRKKINISCIKKKILFAKFKISHSMADLPSSPFLFPYRLCHLLKWAISQTWWNAGPVRPSLLARPNASRVDLWVGEMTTVPFRCCRAWQQLRHLLHRASIYLRRYCTLTRSLSPWCSSMCCVSVSKSNPARRSINSRRL